MIFVTFGFLLIFLTRIDLSLCARGGTLAEQKNYPAQALIMVDHSVGEEKQTFCGATILDKNHILTAASCVVFNEALISSSKILVHAGSQVYSKEKTNLKVSAIFIHNGFDPAFPKHDIAVIRMEKEKFDDYGNDNLKGATLQTEAVNDNAECRFAGFDLPNKESSLRYLDLTIENRKTCNSASIHNGKIFDQMLCAGLFKQTANTGVCPSNRGGGLYCSDRLTGVLSFGVEYVEDEKQKPGVYTEVRSYIDWIGKRLKDESTPEAGPIPKPQTNPNSAAMSASLTVSLLIGILLMNCSIFLCKN